MDRALAIVGRTEAAKDLIREAGELAGGVGADLIALYVIPEEEYDEQRADLADVPEMNAATGVGQARTDAEKYARETTSEALEGVDVEWEAAGAVGVRTEAILEEARLNDCDHIFMAGRSRSPAGKVLFGDDAQQVILSFDDPVTIITE